MDARPWHSCEIEVAHLLRYDGKTYRQIAETLGRNLHCVHHRLSNPAVTPRKWWTDERCARLKELWLAGVKMRLCAAALGTTVGSVAGRLDRMGLYHNSSRPKPEPKVRTKRPVPWSERKKYYQNRARPTPMAKEPDSRNLTFVQLEQNDCRYPVTADSPFLFCGNPQAEGSSYCAHHHHMCWVAPKARVRDVRPR